MLRSLNDLIVGGSVMVYSDVNRAYVDGNAALKDYGQRRGQACPKPLDLQ